MFVSGMSNGQSLTSGGSGMSGLNSEAACQFAGTLLDTAARAAHEALTDHSTKLSTAADHYHRMDEEFGHHLSQFAP
jgi:hypothetical protein